jgi:Tfp pilus assembly protein PilV
VKRSQGLSLGETIIASCLLGLVILAVFNLFPASLFAMRQAEQQIRADQLAQEILETTRQKPFEQLAVGRPDPQPGAEEAAGVRFTPTLQIYQVAGADPDLLLRLRVSVDWKFRGRDQHVFQETYRSHVRRP